MGTRPRPLIPEGSLATRPTAPQAPAKPAEPMRWFRVIGGPQGSKAGSVGPFRKKTGAGYAEFMLAIGKEINSAEYDVKGLKNSGAKLEEIQPPGWYAQQQEDALVKAEELREAGVNVPDPGPAWEPTPLAEQKTA